MLVILSSIAFVEKRPKRAIQIQGTVGILWGAILLLVLFDRAELEWFLPLAVLQALSTAIGEVALLNHVRINRWAVWDLAAAFVATCFGVIYMTENTRLQEALSPAEISTLVSLYLLLFGSAQIFVAVRALKFGPATRDTIRKPGTVRFVEPISRH